MSREVGWVLKRRTGRRYEGRSSEDSRAVCESTCSGGSRICGCGIQPRETRKKLIQALEMLGTKWDKNPAKKHWNIPL